MIFRLYTRRMRWLACLLSWLASASMADQGSWNEADMARSFEATSGWAGSKVRAPCDGRWQLAVTADAAGVKITDPTGAVRQLTLQAGLLPQWHRSSNGCAVLLVSRDGWVFRLDLQRAEVSARVRVGLRLQGTAMSAAGAGQPALLAVANQAPHTLPILDEYLQLQKLLQVTDRYGQHSSAVLGIQLSVSRQSFVLALKTVPELWEVSYNPKAPEIALSMVHDFQYREGQFVAGYLNPQRTSLASPAIDFRLSPDGHEVWSLHAATLDQPHVDAAVVVTHLDVRRPVAHRVLPPGLGLDSLK
jgi:hypothetical protein